MRVVLAEDSVLLREGLTSLLAAEDVDVVAAVDTGPALLGAVARLAPDLALVDVRMPPTFTDEGIRAAVVIRSEHPGTAVMVLSQYVEEKYAGDLLSSSSRGVGYLLKDRVSDVGQFVDDLRRVAAGGTAVDPEVVGQLLARARRDDPLARLTPRETEVLRHMAQGRSNKAIAAGLVVTEKAVEKHVSNIFAKLDLPADGDDHRRVLAVLRHLDGASR
ncbi:LuxR C-terminal-related transcriptional regulator [Kineococcus sp. SYSU DK001]|uniref:LuxR C-terminal-related transcriptional regulator n=1 Tax=Kineococcus sp. SYSU DK001 TaxID=3383122 RepID=UPI003D7F078E